MNKIDNLINNKEHNRLLAKELSNKSTNTNNNKRYKIH